MLGGVREAGAAGRPGYREGHRGRPQPATSASPGGDPGADAVHGYVSFSQVLDWVVDAAVAVVVALAVRS